ncbi:putative CRISPR-associated protein [Microseira sp. BLCC-F43]|jgi:putative CRISPR-associated protein (TIGR02619 family)|uniref:putative CRISPR-associated protein n=1 Tax=Microseira sp. BLCC-F43 TaxID=3153602 RepID=UPI0035B8B2DF
MPRLVISTVGTSLLTNEIRERRDPKGWEDMLKKTANLTHKQISQSYPEVLDIIQELKHRAEDKLNNANTIEIRDASAELNGIYGLYKEQLSQGSQDIHWLIASDTAQDQVTAKMLEEFLRKQGLNVNIYIPKGFSASSTEVFTNGIDELLNWIDNIVPGYKDSGYQICFNLVGGFKAIQGFANTIGMFYAHEIIYIFEGNRDIITIPRLPIQVDKSAIKPVEFALMASEVGVSVKLSELQNVPETLIFVVGEEVTLSNWGKLTWNNCKRELLAQDLLEFPCLVYEKSFVKDYQKNNVNAQKKFELHEVLAEVSGSMLKFNGDTTRFDSRLHFTRYEGGQKCEGGVKKNQIDHFYIKNTGWRVSCITKDRKLYLRHYGEHDYVNDNP